MDAGDNVERTVTHDKPLILRVWQLNEPAALRPLIAVALAAGRHSGVTPRSSTRNGGETECSLKRGDAALVIGTTREKFAFGTFDEVARQHHHTALEAQIADEEQQRNAHGSPFLQTRR